MNKLILYLTVTFFIIPRGYAQWNESIYLKTFNTIYANSRLVDVNFVSEKSGMYSYFHMSSPSSGGGINIQFTNDGGYTWDNVWSTAGIGISTYAIHKVYNQNTFYHINNWQGSTSIGITNNGGKSWTKSPIGTSGYYRDFSVIDTSNYFLLYEWFDEKQYINKMTNGIAYLKIDSFLNERVRLLCFPDTTTGYIVASTLQNPNLHLILKSITGGTHWFNVFNDGSINIHKLFFTSTNIGYAVCDFGKIIKTNNGGVNWEYLHIGSTDNLNSIFFLNDTVGYVAGENGYIGKTIDGGLHWKQQITGITYPFTKIFFVNDTVGFALSGETLFKTNQKLGQLLPAFNGELLVYPNPFSNQTTFQCTDPLDHAILTLTNSFGQTVKQVENINGTTFVLLRDNLVSGMYYVQIIDDDKTYTSKIFILEP